MGKSLLNSQRQGCGLDGLSWHLPGSVARRGHGCPRGKEALTMPGIQGTWNPLPPTPMLLPSACPSHSPLSPCDVPPPPATPKRAKSLEQLSSDSLSLQRWPALPAKNTLSQCSSLHFAYVLQPNSAFKAFLFHLLINFYLPRRREDNTGDAVCDVCCSLTTL